MTPNSVMTAFYFLQSLQVGDTEMAGVIAHVEPRLPSLSAFAIPGWVGLV